MKIEEIFRNNLLKDEMPVDNGLWNRLSNRINIPKSNISTAKSSMIKSVSKIKAMSFLTKTAIIVLGSGIVALGTIILYNVEPYSLQDTNKDISYKSDTNDENLNIDIDLTDTTLQPIKQKTENHVLPQDEFPIINDTFYIANEFTDIDNLDEFITATPAPVAIKSIKQPNTNTTIHHYDTTRIKSSDRINIEIPNFLTPNGDGINDCFVIKNIENYPNNKLIIFARNGKIIYQQDNYNNEFCPQNLTVGVYFYRLTVQNQNSKQYFNGVIHIIY